MLGWLKIYLMQEVLIVQYISKTKRSFYVKVTFHFQGKKNCFSFFFWQIVSQVCQVYKRKLLKISIREKTYFHWS